MAHSCGGEVAEEAANAAPSGLGRAGVGFAQQGLELGEDLLDRIEIGRVARQEEQLGASAADQVAYRLAFVTAEIVHDDDVARTEGRHQELFDIGAKAGAVDRPVDDAGAVMRSWRSAARKVSVRQRPCGTLATSRAPRRQRPWRRVMLVMAQVSAMNTRRRGSSRP